MKPMIWYNVCEYKYYLSADKSISFHCTTRYAFFTDYMYWEMTCSFPLPFYCVKFSAKWVKTVATLATRLGTGIAFVK